MGKSFQKRGIPPPEMAQTVRKESKTNSNYSYAVPHKKEADFSKILEDLDQS